MAFRLKALFLALLLALGLSACGPTPAEPTPAQAEEPQGRLYYLGSAADPLSELLFDRLEDWARSANWAFVSYDCRGMETTQAGQIDDVTRRETPGVAVLYPVGQPAAQDEAVKKLSKADFAVITLNRPCGAFARGYVSCHIGLKEEDVLPAAARMVNDALGRRDAGYIRLSDYWPDPQGDALAQALFPAYHLQGEGYTGGRREYGTLAVEDLMDSEDAVPDFLFSMSQAAALGAADATEDSDTWADVPVFALQGDMTGAKEVAYGRLAGTVCVSPQDLTERLLDAIPQVTKTTRRLQIDLTPTPVTPANAREFLKEYEN